MPEEKTTEESGGKKKRSKKKLGRWIGLVVVLIAIGLAAWAFMGLQKAKQELKGGEEGGVLSDEEIAELVEEVSELIVLPPETPTVAVVENAEQIKQAQAFFKDAVDGDQVLIFPQAAKAFIYRPDGKRLINVGPITAAGAPQAAPAAAPVQEPVVEEEPTEPVSVEVRNGSGAAGQARAIADELAAANELFEIGTVGNSTRAQAYQETVIVDVAGTGGPLVQQAAEALGAQVVTALPEGEGASGADIVVLVGADVLPAGGAGASGAVSTEVIEGGPAGQ